MANAFQETAETRTTQWGMLAPADTSGGPTDTAWGTAPMPNLWKTDFRFLAKTPSGTHDISGLVEAATWQDQSSDALERINTQAAMIGSLGLRKPGLHQYKQLVPSFLADGRWGALGMVVIAQVGYGGKWQSIWAMRVVPGDDATVAEQIEVSDGTWTLTLADDLWLLAQSTADFKFIKGKKIRTKGWRAHEIAHDVCTQFKIPTATLTEGTAYFELPLRTTRVASPLAVIAAAYKAEYRHTGNVFIIRWATPTSKYPTGALEVIPMKRNPNLLSFRDQLITATLTRSQSVDFCTVIEARGIIKDVHGDNKSDPSEKEDSGGDSGGDSSVRGASPQPGANLPTFHLSVDNPKFDNKKVEYIAKNEQAIKRFGWVQKVVSFGTVQSRAELEILAKRALVVRLTPIRTAELTHPGVTTIRRGDAIRIDIPEEGYAKGTPQAAKQTQSSNFGGSMTLNTGALTQAEQDEPWLFGLPDPSAAAKTSNPPSEVKNDANTPATLPVTDQGVAFVTSIVHTVGAGDYTIDMQTSFIDVLDPDEVQAEKDKTVRDEKASEKRAAELTQKATKGGFGGGIGDVNA